MKITNLKKNKLKFSEVGSDNYNSNELSDMELNNNSTESDSEEVEINNKNQFPFGVEYHSIKSFREAFRVYAAKKGLSYKITRNRTNRLRLICPSINLKGITTKSSCKFGLLASHSQGPIKIKSLKLKHSLYCVKPEAKASYKTLRLLASDYSQKLDQICARDLINIAKKDTGISSSYSSAWRAVQHVEKTDTLRESRIFYVN